MNTTSRDFLLISIEMSRTPAVAPCAGKFTQPSVQCSELLIGTIRQPRQRIAPVKNHRAAPASFQSSSIRMSGCVYKKRSLIAFPSSSSSQSFIFFFLSSLIRSASPSNKYDTAPKQTQRQNQPQTLLRENFRNKKTKLLRPYYYWIINKIKVLEMTK